MARNYLQGRFVPTNPSKYRGDPTAIFFRSGWERKAMVFFDTHPQILEWSSEEVIIPYVSPVDGRPHRYFPDFYVKRQTNSGQIIRSLVEVKPLKQTKPPEKKSRVTKTFINEVQTYAINTAKWESARQFCSKRGLEFMILTENELYGK